MGFHHLVCFYSNSRMFTIQRWFRQAWFIYRVKIFLSWFGSTIRKNGNSSCNGSLLDGWNNSIRWKRLEPEGFWWEMFSQRVFQVIGNTRDEKKLTNSGFGEAEAHLCGDSHRRIISNNLKDYFLDFSSKSDRLLAPKYRESMVFYSRLFLAIFLGWLFPLLDYRLCDFHGKFIINIGIGLVFFFYWGNT